MEKMLLTAALLICFAGAHAEVEEAMILVETDPAVKSKMLDADFFSWYGSAALSEYLPYHEKVEKKKML